MENRELINQFHQKNLEIYDKEGLTCLRGTVEDDYILNGKNILVWHSEATSKLKHKFNHFENIDSLLFISDEIMYFTAQLYFYKPYLNNPLENPLRIKDKVYYPYKMSLSDKRYFMFSEIVIEKIYSFWGQIANLLAASLDEEINDQSIFFPGILQKITNKSSDNFLWLDNFKKNEYSELNSHRKMIVHHRGLETKFRSDHIKSFSSKEQMEMVIHDRDGLTDYFKTHINLTLTGFEKSLGLIIENSLT
jgi:hypothetical protein